MKLPLHLRSFHTFVLILFITLFTSFSAHSQDTTKQDNTNQEAPALDKLTGEALHLKLVEIAYQYDSYNTRCRGLSISREVNDVNRLFLRKYGITINNFIKLNIDRDVRGYQSSVKQNFYNTLYELGGCDGAKDTEFLNKLRDNYRMLLENARTSPWFPRT